MSQCQPLVSVVMAAKNYARFLPLAVRSVQAQTFANWELVIVDDGSNDNTASVIQPFLADARIQYHRSDTLGQTRAKNLAARLSRGQLLAYLDADDAWLPTKLERQVDLIRRSPRVGVCFTQRLFMDEADTIRPANDPPAPSGQVLPVLFLRNFVCFSSVMIRRDAFEHIGGFDLNWDLSVDYDLWLRVAKHYEFQQIPEPLTIYRTGHGNLSKRLADRVSTAFAIMDRAIEHRGLQLPIEVIREGYASTYRTLAFVMRRAEPFTAMRLYGHAIRTGGIWQNEVWRGLVRAVLCALRPRDSLLGENATANR